MSVELLGEYGRRRLIRSVIDAWNGAATASKVLTEHSASSQHHITVSTSNGAATGTLRIRMVPTGLGRSVAISDEMEAIVLVDVGRSKTFVVNGFYEAISATFTSPLSAGTVTVTVTSTGEHLSALPVPGAREHGRKVPPTTVITSAWTGASSAGKVTPGHVGMALHHFALACATVPVAGSVRVQGKPVGSSVFVNLTEQESLTATGTLNLFFEGFYEEFRIVPSGISGSGGIVARVASSGEDLNTHVNVDSRIDDLQAEVDADEAALAAHIAAPDPHPQYTTTAEAQAIADAKVVDSIADSDTTHAPSRNAVFDALALKAANTAPQVRRNWLINGAFLLWQRGTTLAAATSYRYLCDRWFSGANAPTTMAPSRQAFTLGQTDVPGNPLAYHRCVVASSGSASSAAILEQRVENVTNLSGEQVTFSFYAKADSAKPMSVEFVQNFGSGGSADVTGIGATKVNLTTAWQRFTVTVTLPSIAGKTAGPANFLRVVMWFEAGSSFNARTVSLGNQNGTFDIALCRLEKGAVASDFEEEDYTDTFTKCQRYYEQTYPTSTPAGSIISDGNEFLFISGNGATAHDAGGKYCSFKVTKRGTPTITIYSPNTGASGKIYSSGIGDETASAPLQPGASGFGAWCTFAAPGSDINLYWHWTADSEL